VDDRGDADSQAALGAAPEEVKKWLGEDEDEDEDEDDSAERLGTSLTRRRSWNALAWLIWAERIVLDDVPLVSITARQGACLGREADGELASDRRGRVGAGACTNSGNLGGAVAAGGRRARAGGKPD